MSIIQYQTKMNALLQDDSNILSQPEKDIALQMAVKYYSRVRPREVVSDLAGNDGFDYDLPSTWNDGFSFLKQVEYPAGEQQPVYLHKEDVTLYRNASALKLRFLRDTPATGKTARVTFTALHTLTASSASIPSSDEDAVAALGAAYACEALSNHYAKTTEPTLQADVVDHRSKSQEFAGRAKRLRALFLSSLGIKDENEVAPASGTRDWFTDSSWGEDRLLHPRDRR
jgi:hypothetical protein